MFKILSEPRAVLDDLAHLLSQNESVRGEELRKMLLEHPNPERGIRRPVGRPKTLPEEGTREQVIESPLQS